MTKFIAFSAESIRGKIPCKMDTLGCECKESRDKSEC
jgi:hypothetical protein